MIYLCSILKVVDNTGVDFVRCIKVLGYGCQGKIFIGDLLVVVVRHMYPAKKKVSRATRGLKKGIVSRAMLIRTKRAISRGYGMFISFNQNGVIMVNKRGKPVGRRIKGPVI